LIFREFRGQHLQRHEALQVRIETLEHDAHAALADDLGHIKVPESSQVEGILRGLEEIEGDLLARARGWVDSGHLDGGALQVFHDIPELRLGGRTPGLGLAYHLSTGRATAGQLLERVLATRAAVEVADQLCLLVLRQAAIEQLLEASVIWTRSSMR